MMVIWTGSVLLMPVECLGSMPVYLSYRLFTVSFVLTCMEVLVSLTSLQQLISPGDIMNF